MEIAASAQKGFLHDILRVIFIPCITPRHGGQPLAVAFHDGGKGFIIPLDESIN
jgi:hypothetical protein